MFRVFLVFLVFLVDRKTTARRPGFSVPGKFGGVLSQKSLKLRLSNDRAEQFWSEAVFFDSAVVFLESEAVFLESEAVFLHSEAVFWHSEAVFLRSEAVFLRSEAVFLRSEAVFLESEAVFLESEAVFLEPADFRLIRVVGTFPRRQFRPKKYNAKGGDDSKHSIVSPSPFLPFSLSPLLGILHF
ncbi:MAG: hypothetical protein JSS81_13990 [Acidobacteria bacterium]|nr:hypothetical protein [Acidobacteriota bacterium]